MNLKNILAYIFRSWKDEYNRNGEYVPYGAKILPPIFYDLLFLIIGLGVVGGIIHKIVNYFS